MNLKHIDIFGKSYPMCFNVRVIAAGEDKFGSIDLFNEAIFSYEIEIKNFIWFLATLLDAGYRVAKKEGINVEQPPKYDELLDILTMKDIPALRMNTMLTVINDSKRKIEFEEEKKEETTR